MIKQTEGKRSRDPVPQFSESERFLAVGAVAGYFGVTDVTIKNWVDQGKLLASRTAGGHRRIATSSVAQLLELQGRAIPAELASRATALVIEEGDSLGKHLRRSVGGRAHVLVVHDHYVAILVAARTRPSVIVLDFDLPKCDVRRFLDALRGDGVLRDVDVVGLLGSERQKPAPGAEGEGLGLLYLFRKLERDAIVASVNAILDRRRPARAL